MPRHARGRSRDPRKTRLLALAGVVAVCAVALPLAVASAGSVHSDRPSQDEVRPLPGGPSPGGSSPGADDKALGASKSAPSAVPTLPTLGQGLATAVRCGPEVSSPDGIEAQTCVVTQGARTWARTYYRNATGEALDAVLTLMEPGARTVRMTCAVSAEDEPRTCETPREPVRGNLAAYTAVAEFARRAGQGPLLLRSGSNSPAWTGS
ncbi:hypothetical protein ACFT4A_27660 [Streptomyces sp. NPDC057099]|uniref:hypothetical protein n=1 Tax=Streptomyces sp. NPDC057099 TaxID=3346019 RepID=UPI0036278471